MWKWRKRETVSAEFAAIRQAETALTEQHDKHAAALGEQISKLARMHYKSNQDVNHKLEQLQKLTTSITAWQQSESTDKQKLALTLQRTAENSIAWLDDMDAVCSRLQGTEHEAWRHLLTTWSEQLLNTLALANIHELKLLGASFDPQLSEAIGTRPRTGGSEAASTTPYQIVEVVKRGFIDGNGKLLRKAQVITLEEIEDDNDEFGTD